MKDILRIDTALVEVLDFTTLEPKKIWKVRIIYLDLKDNSETKYVRSLKDVASLIYERG